MHRLLVSMLAGALLVLGGWYGWSHHDQIVSPLEPRDGRPSNSPSSPPPPASADHALSPEGTRPGTPCQVPGPTDAGGMNRLFSKLDGVPTLQGADHGGSAPLADGRRIFVFGDTIREHSLTPFMVYNSVLVANDGCIAAMPVDGGGSAIPDEGRAGYWPMSLRSAEVPGGTVVQVVAAKVRRKDQNDFETLGSSLATFEVPTNRSPRFMSNVPLGRDSTDPRVPTWGAAMWEHDGVVYVYGTASNATKSTSGWSLHVARTSSDRLERPETWEYWDGAGWVAGDPSAATAEGAALVPAERGVSHVLSVFEREDHWYAISKEGDWVGETLAVWKAPTPHGPFTKHHLASLENDQHIRRYTPLAHPDFETESGHLLVSYSESPTSETSFYHRPELYRPRFIEVALP